MHACAACHRRCAAGRTVQGRPCCTQHTSCNAWNHCPGRHSSNLWDCKGSCEAMRALPLRAPLLARARSHVATASLRVSKKYAVMSTVKVRTVSVYDMNSCIELRLCCLSGRQESPRTHGASEVCRQRIRLHDNCFLCISGLGRKHCKFIHVNFQDETGKPTTYGLWKQRHETPSVPVTLSAKEYLVYS